MFPQSLVNVRYKKDFDWKNDPQFQQIQAEVMQELGKNGRILVRASGTEPVLRVMVEATDQFIAQSLAEKIASKVPKAS